MNRNTNVLLALVLSAAALAASATGCELIAAVDRSQIPGAGGAGGSGGSGGSGGTGATGGSPPMCTDPAADCPAAPACKAAACEAGACVENNAAAGTACTDAGNPAAKVCDDAGQCVACNAATAATDCPMPPNECVVATCMAGVCGTMNVADGTATTTGQIDGDCKKVVCDGAGATKTIDDDDPTDDDNDCTTDTCVLGTNMHDKVAAGVACTQNSGKVCGSGTKLGTCVECLVEADCTDPVNTHCDTTSDNFVCVPAGCNDGVPNGTETGLDCGGPLCGDCPNGEGCSGPDDCVSNFCNSANPKVCAACTNDGDCAAAEFCALPSGVCTPDKPTGQSCTSASQCTSTFCTDGFCCDAACGSLCEACSAAKKSQGVDGTCGPVAAGIDLDNECAQDAASTCDQNGSCNGAGACQLYAVGTICLPQSCTSAVQSNADTCNGTGTCVDNSTLPCDPYQCNAAGTACRTSCTADGDCTSGNYCNATVCTPKKVTGTACGADNECTLGFCRDGFCCGTTCGALCQACSAAKTGGANGTCANITTGTDPDNECALDATSTCNKTGSCAAGACQQYSAGTICAAASCAAGVQTNADTCNGTGTCVDNSTTNCAPYVCNGGGTACLTSCTVDGNCAAATPKCNTGNGTCVQCLTPANCPPTGNECIVATCNSNVCGTAFLDQTHTLSTGQSSGDCQKIVCNGAGGITSADDPTDLPTSNTACLVSPACVGPSPLTPSFTSQPAGTDCTADGQAPKKVCGSGVFAGSCVECNSGADCSSDAGTCSAAHTCQ